MPFQRSFRWAISAGACGIGIVLIGCSPGPSVGGISPRPEGSATTAPIAAAMPIPAADSSGTAFTGSVAAPTPAGSASTAGVLPPAVATATAAVPTSTVSRAASATPNPSRPIATVAIPTPTSLPTAPPTIRAANSNANNLGDLKRTNEGGNITIDITWDRGAGTSSSLVFSMAMNTHSVDLDKIDLGKMAFLRDDLGRQVAPERWQSPAGGHHRSGTLVFPAATDGAPLLTAQTKFLEIVVSDVAGVKERIFRWEISS